MIKIDKCDACGTRRLVSELIFWEEEKLKESVQVCRAQCGPNADGYTTISNEVEQETSLDNEN